MPSWDRQSPQAQAKIQDAALRAQLRDSVGPFSPYWRERFAALRKPASSITSVRELAALPAVGERDVCPDGDPRGAARLVLQADEGGYALHSPGPDLRKALVRRVRGAAAYRRQVEAATRPTTYHLGGRAFSFPIASTRADLDVVARAGNRAWQVLGLSRSDVLVSAVPAGATLDHLFLVNAALGAGAPALHPRVGDDLAPVAAALRELPATVLALPAATAAETAAALAGAGAPFDGITTVLVVGATTDDQLPAALADAGLGSANVRRLYGPPEGRVLWAECQPGSGFHTYPDLDVVEIVDPETAEPTTGGGELVVTQLGFRGTALLRWRTGDLVSGPVATTSCPGCARTVPRVPSDVRAGALVPRVELRSGLTSVDARALAGALTGRPDLADWRVETVRSSRDGARDLVVLVAPEGDETDAAVGAYGDVLAASGVRPAQVVVVDRMTLASRPPGSPTPRVDLPK